MLAVWRQLRKEAGHIRRGRHKPGRRGHGVAHVVARHDQALAERKLTAVAHSHRGAPRKARHVGHRFLQACSINHMAHHPARVLRARDLLHHQPEQAIAVVRILELHPRLQRRLVAQVRQQFCTGEKGPPVQELARVGAVARDACGVRQQLANARPGQVFVQAIDIAANGVVQADLSLLAQQHDPSGREALGVRRDAQAVPGREGFASSHIGHAQRQLCQGLAAACDGHGTPGLAEALQLQAQPLRHIVQCRLEPG